MFTKKCPRCSVKVKKGYDFCPSCGHNLTKKFNDTDYGILGKNDFINPMTTFPKFGNPIIDNLLKNMEPLMKSLEKQMMDSMEKQPNQNMNSNTNPNKVPNNLRVQFFVNGKKMPMTNPGKQNQIQPIEQGLKFSNKISVDMQEKLQSLPRKEAITKPVKRISGKLVYELSIPGVTSIENVLINQLETSIEVKAIGDDTIFFKTLNVKLPIVGYSLTDGALILELKPNN